MLSLIMAFCFNPAFAQIDQTDPGRPLVNEGSLFVIKLVPGQKRMQLFVTGKEVARIEKENLVVSATSDLQAGKWRVTLKPEGDHFWMDYPSDLKRGEKFDLNVEVKVKGEIENLKLKGVVLPSPR